MGQRDRYIPRRSQQERRRHPLRNILIVLLILCCAAFAALRWGLPLWLDYVTPDSDTGIQSSQVSENPHPAETSSPVRAEPSTPVMRTARSSLWSACPWARTAT